MSELQIDKVLDEAFSKGASHILLHAGHKPRMRVNGELQNMTYSARIDPDDTMSLMKSVTPERNQDNFWDVGQAHFCLAYGSKGTVVVDLHRDFGNVVLDLKLVPRALKTMEELGLPHEINSMMANDSGLILVTGQSNSGRSTMIRAMINEINANEAKHIVDIGDPIEFSHVPQESSVQSVNAYSVADAIHTAIKANADVIHVGPELQDPDIIMATMDAVESGALVIATMRSESTPHLEEVCQALQSRLNERQATYLANVFERSMVGRIHQEIAFVDESVEGHTMSQRPGKKLLFTTSDSYTANWAPPVLTADD